MVTPRRFSPAERIATEIGFYLARKLKVEFTMLTFAFDCLPEKRFVWNPKYENNGFGLPEEENLKMRLMDEISGEVLITETSGVTKSRSFLCINCLRTSKRYSDPNELPQVARDAGFENIENVSIGVEKYFSPEALDSMQFKSGEYPPFEFARLQSKIYDARPFDQYYVLTNVNLEKFVLLGPTSRSAISYRLGDLDVTGHKHELSVDEWAIEKYGFKPETTEPPIVETDSRKKIKIILVEKGYKQAFEFGQTFGLFNGSSWDGFAFLELLKLVVFLELNASLKEPRIDWNIVPGFDVESWTLTVPVHVVRQRCYLDEEVSNFSRTYAAQNEFVMDVLDRFSANENTFIVRDNEGRLARVSSSFSTIACFVWSFARLICRSDYVCDLIRAIVAALDAGLIEIVNGSLHEIGQVKGSTAALQDKPLQVNLKLATQVVSYTLKRKSYYGKDILKASDGLMLFGWDKKVDNDNGDPNHWILARKDGEALYAVYDPYRVGSFFAEGDNITHLINAHDAMCACFKDLDEDGDSSTWAF